MGGRPPLEPDEGRGPAPRDGSNETPAAITRPEQSAQHLQALGKFAGGLAHEVNNMMTAIMGFGRLAATSLGEDHPTRPDIDEIVKAADRAATVTRQLLMFSRQQGLPTSVSDMSALVNECQPMLSRILGPTLRLRVHVPSLGPRAKINASQLEQVLVNLVANARDASIAGGEVVVSVTREKIAKEGAHDATAVAFDRVIRLEIRDAGSGMRPEVMSHAFEPFFTTKEIGRGTGLGLSVVREIVHQWEGTIGVTSAPGVGTTVTIRLPEVDEAVSSAATRDQEPPARGRGERILVVEDEALVGTVVRRLLTVMGYHVTLAANGPEALEFLDGHRGEVDLVLADVIMPGLNGVELANRILRAYPSVAVLLMSGYTGDEMARRGFACDRLQILPKPFTPDRLARVVRSALEASGPRPA